MAYTQPLRQTLEKQGYQVYFQGAGKPIKVSKGGQTYEIKDYQIKGGTAYVDPSTLSKLTTTTTTSSAPKVAAPSAGDVPVRSSLEQAGLKVSYNPSNKSVTVTHPVTGYSYTWTPTKGVEGKYYASPEEIERVKGYVTPSYEKVPQQVMADLAAYQKQMTDMWNQYYNNQQQLISGYMKQMTDYIKQWQEAGLDMMRQYQQQYSVVLEQLQKLMNPDPTVPESVKLALDLVKKQTDENIRVLNEEMIRRGIYGSTIAADRIRKLQETMTDEQRAILAQWLDNQHKQMLQATLQYAAAQERYAQGLANMYGQVYQRPIEMSMNLLQGVTSMQQGLAQQGLQLQKDLATQGLNVSTQLRQWAGQQEDAARQARLQQELEAQKAAQEQARWEAEQALKQAQFQLDVAKAQEEARHNRAMESRPTGSSYPSVSLLKYWQDLQDKAAQEKMASEIRSLAQNLGVNEPTAAAILDLDRGGWLKNPNAALAQVEYMKNNPNYAGADWGYVSSYVKTKTAPKSSTTSSSGWKPGTPIDIESVLKSLFKGKPTQPVQAPAILKGVGAGIF